MDDFFYDLVNRTTTLGTYFYFIAFRASSIQPNSICILSLATVWTDRPSLILEIGQLNLELFSRPTRHASVSLQSTYSVLKIQQTKLDHS